ncbi:MAG: circadian clock protein KaiC [Candidatus Binatia bacterium]
MNQSKQPLPALAKAPTGIRGLDEITGGGLPRGRTSLTAGAGKTLFGMEFIYRGATQFGEPGVVMAFEETETELIENVASLGFDFDGLIKRNQLAIDFVRVERSEIEETGEYDLEGLFIRLGHAIDEVKAKRVLLDTIEALFAALPNEGVLRAELRRLFRWLKERGVTAVITAERGSGALTRHGLEEYVSDCVILLDHRVIEQVSTRRLRVVKYRGTTHGTNEYPFLIDAGGISVLPVTSIGLNHEAPTGRISSGIDPLDAMLDGRGYYRGGSILISGTPGAGKSSIAAHFIYAACQRGERCMYFAFEESQSQIVRNMRSIGVDLGRGLEDGGLRFYPTRPQLQGLESHLAHMLKQIGDFDPAVVVVDPMTNLLEVGNLAEAKAMLIRLVDFLKARKITAMFTSLTVDQSNPERTEVGISSIMDTWLLLRNIETNGERNRGLYILKSRGMPHSNQIREFTLTDHGAQLREVYAGVAGVLAGTARVAQEAREQAEALAQQQEIERKRRELESKRLAMEAQIASLRAAFTSESAEIEKAVNDIRIAEDLMTGTRAVLAGLRGADAEGKSGKLRRKGVNHGSERRTGGKANGRKDRHNASVE